MWFDICDRNKCIPDFHTLFSTQTFNLCVRNEMYVLREIVPIQLIIFHANKAKYETVLN